MGASTPATILIMDNEPSFVSGLARLLRRDGYTVDTADHEHGILAQLHAHHWNVILYDLRIPALDGPAFFARLRPQYASLRQRVIFLTGDLLSAASLAFLEQCGQPWLCKPCTIAAIRSAIQQVLRAVE